VSRIPIRLTRACTLLPTAFLISVFFGACAGNGEADTSAGGGGGAEAAAPEVWRLSDTPLLEIGVREGEAAYQLDRASSSVRLADGRIAVLDGGSRQLRFFDAQGRFLRAVGAEGEGPGEFRNPTRLRRTPGDSLQVWDATLARLSFFDSLGAYLGSEVHPPDPENPMPLDVWLFRRSWIDSPVPMESRGPIRGAVEALPALEAGSPPRILRVTRQGRIWASPTYQPSPSASTWTVYDLDGRAAAMVEIPARFEPHDIGPDYVLGRYRDELELNYIRLFRLEKPADSPAGPGIHPVAWRGRGIQGLAPSNLPPERLNEVREVARDALYATAAAQEIHYAGNYTYTTDLPALVEGLRGRREIPEGMTVTILLADDRGWMGTATHEETGYMCALAYGAYLPMGWPPGSLACP